MNLSNSFTLERLTFSETATRKGISNVPTPEQIANLVDLAATLERVQDLVGPIHVNSAFRSRKLNAVIGGSPTSDHLEGYAGDITAPSFGTPLEVCQAIAGSGIPFDQLICEGSKKGSPETGWCHISSNPRMRQEVLTATFINGRVTYSAGLGEQLQRTA